VNSPDGLAGKRIFKGTTGRLNLLGAFIYDNSLYVGLGGTWLSTGSKDGTVIMKGTTDLDFSVYSCGIIVDDLRAWDTDWHPTATFTPTAGAGTVTINTLAVTAGKNF